MKPKSYNSIIYPINDSTLASYLLSGGGFLYCEDQKTLKGYIKDIFQNIWLSLFWEKNLGSFVDLPKYSRQTFAKNYSFSVKKSIAFKNKIALINSFI